MAYNKTFNPDALPAFAEPERKHPNKTSPSDFPPRQSSNQAPSDQPYGNKPPPPLPKQNNLQGGGAYGSGARRQPSPVMQPQGNYSYSSSPPPQGTGRFAQNQQGRPVGRPPPSPAPGGGSASDPSLLPLFRAVDKDGSGQLSEKELGAALVNGDWSSFDMATVRLMIRMFDTDRSGTIGFDEFCGLWSFLASWRSLFDRFDTDRSGAISLDEFSNALTAFGYRLSPDFVRFLFGTYDKQRTNQLSFDLFVQSCISLKRMTDVFKRYDDDRDGFITLSFEDFLTEILRQR